MKDDNIGFGYFILYICWKSLNIIAVSFFILLIIFVSYVGIFGEPCWILQPIINDTATWEAMQRCGRI